MAPRLPPYRWYECDVCKVPALKERIAPKQLTDRKVKCKLTYRCTGRMSGPIENPTEHEGWHEDNVSEAIGNHLRSLRCARS